jgi:hypothetical protein
MHRPARRWLVASHAMLQGMTEAPVAALLWRHDSHQREPEAGVHLHLLEIVGLVATR